MNVLDSRFLLRSTALFAAVLGLACFNVYGADEHEATPAGVVESDQILAKLLDGNFRYTEGKSRAQSTYLQKRNDNTKGQKPFAVIVCCSDSRVPPEVIFDQSIGDLFVVRSAGHVVDDVALGSIEYAVEHLHCAYIMVLGHERCGAVLATVEGAEVSGHIAAVVKAIKPAFDLAKYKNGDPVENTIRANIQWVVIKLNNSGPYLAKLVQAGKLKVQGARYDLETGKVELVN